MSLALPPSSVPGSPGAASWNQLVDRAVEERFRRARSADAALASGELVVSELCGFAAGSLDAATRRNTEAFLARTPWALGRVTALVRAARDTAQDGGLAAKLLDAARQGELTDGRRQVAAALAAAGDPEDGPLRQLSDRIAPLDDPEAALLEVVSFV